ncbi:hypothetical protein Drorol1_Dr00005035 [Drosera rotundifolia]
MVTRFGMSEIGPWAVGDPSLQQSDVFMRMLALNMSEKLAEDIDPSVRKIVDVAYEIAKTYIKNNREAMDKLVEVLLERNSNRRRIQSNHVFFGRHFFSRIEADSTQGASGAEVRIRFWWNCTCDTAVVFIFHFNEEKEKKLSMPFYCVPGGIT